MRTSTAALALGGALAALPILFVGIANAATPAPAPPPAPTTPTYICDNVFHVNDSVFGYTNCQAYGGVSNSTYFPDGTSYMLIPRQPGGSDSDNSTVGKIQKFRCHGGNVDLPSAVAPEHCEEVGSAIPSSEAPPPVPFTGTS